MPIRAAPEVEQRHPLDGHPTRPRDNVAQDLEHLGNR